MGLSTTHMHMAVMGTVGPMGHRGPAVCKRVAAVHVRHINLPGRMSRTSQAFDLQGFFKTRPGRPADSTRTHVHPRIRRMGAGRRAHAHTRMTFFHGRILKVVKRVMNSTTCDVRDNVRDIPPRTDVRDGLLPAPSNIKDQMPGLAKMLQHLSQQLGRESVQLQVKATMDLRKAFDANDYRAVSAVYRRGHGWIYWEEGGYCMGVPEAAMRAFANKHRRA